MVFPSATFLSLPRWVRLERYEPPHGCLLRLAECNGLPGTKELRLITGLKVGNIRTGEDLDQLASVLNCDVAALAANAILHKNNAQAVVAGHILRPGADLVSNNVRRLCPACMAESAYHRVWWDWSFISTCPSHGCMLVDLCGCGSRLSWKDGSPTKCRECTNGDVRDLPLQLAHSRMTAPDRWAIEQFIGHGPLRVELLENVPLGYAAELVKRIGTLDLFGYRPVHPRLVDPEEIRNARARGFELIASGSVAETLGRAYDGYVKSTGGSSPTLQKMYGWFYPWFMFNGGPRLFYRLGEEIFRDASTKIQVTRRAFSSLLRAGTGPVTLSEAASMAKVGTATMRKLLSMEGLIRAEKRKGLPVLVERAVAERMSLDIADALSLTGLGGHLGLSRTALFKLVRSDVIPSWVAGGKVGQLSYLFRRAEITKWMDELLGDVPTVQVPPAGTISLADTPNACHIASTALVNAIKRREIRVIGVCGEKRDFQTALVYADDVRRYRYKIGAVAASDPLRKYRRSK
ncbi:TniQ family protein [Bradyrhizobium sp. USDA 4529]